MTIEVTNCCFMIFLVACFLIMWKAVALSLRSFLCEVHGSTFDYNYAPDPRMLDPFITAKIADQDLVNALWRLIVELQTLVSSSDTVPQHLQQWTEDYRPCKDVSLQTQEAILYNDSRIVQIVASKAEIDRRINAFIKKKRLEVDAFNVREFCAIPECEEAISCARVDASYVPRQSKKSLLKVSSVLNAIESEESPRFRPATAQAKTYAASHPSTSIPYRFLPSDLKERLSNMESHLSMFSTGRDDVHKQIKSLEERLLYLETLSPEYFVLTSKPFEKSSTSQINNAQLKPIAQSPEDVKARSRSAFIDLRIAELKEKLLSKPDG